MQQNRIDHAKDRGVPGDPEGKGENGNESESRRLEQLSDGETEIVYHIVRQVSFIAKRDDWIHASRAARGDQTGRDRDQTEQKRCPRKEGRIMRGNFVKLRSEKPAENKNCRQADE